MRIMLPTSSPASFSSIPFHQPVYTCTLRALSRNRWAALWTGQICHFIGFYAWLAPPPPKEREGTSLIPRFRHHRPDMSVAVAHLNSQPMPRSSTTNHSPMDSKKAVIKTEGQSPLSHHFHCRAPLLSLPLTPVPRVITTHETHH